MKAVYVRTSTDANDGKAQEHELEQYARTNNWVGYEKYIDIGETGAKESRPEWDRLREDIRKGRVTEVAATELCRMGRTVTGVMMALEEMQRMGCRVILLREGLDFATPVGRAFAAILSAVAQLEREQITARVRSGMRKAKEKGTRSGKPIGRPRAKIAVVDLEKAEMMLDDGCPWIEVAKEIGTSATTLRRAIKAIQKGVEKWGKEKEKNQGGSGGKTGG